MKSWHVGQCANFNTREVSESLSISDTLREVLACRTIQLFDVSDSSSLGMSDSSSLSLSDNSQFWTLARFKTSAQTGLVSWLFDETSGNIILAFSGGRAYAREEREEGKVKGESFGKFWYLLSYAYYYRTFEKKVTIVSVVMLL